MGPRQDWATLVLFAKASSAEKALKPLHRLCVKNWPHNHKTWLSSEAHPPNGQLLPLWSLNWGQAKLPSKFYSKFPMTKLFRKNLWNAISWIWFDLLNQEDIYPSLLPSFLMAPSTWWHPGVQTSILYYSRNEGIWKGQGYANLYTGPLGMFQKHWVQLLKPHQVVRTGFLPACLPWW